MYNLLLCSVMHEVLSTFIPDGSCHEPNIFPLKSYSAANAYFGNLKDKSLKLNTYNNRNKNEKLLIIFN